MDSTLSEYHQYASTLIDPAVSKLTFFFKLYVYIDSLGKLAGTKNERSVFSVILLVIISVLGNFSKF